ncbi:MAG: hypothetical protein WCK65_10615, partial [Rhodospirillaceae bacterium]
MTPPDPRRHPWRADLAALELKGLVPSRRFVAGALRQVRTGSASLKLAPEDCAEQSSELLHGESFTIYEDAAGWAWGQSSCDGYVGYVRTAVLDAEVTAPSHRVTALRTFIYPEPGIKRPPRDTLSLTSLVTVTERNSGYAALAGGGWVYAGHLAAIDQVEPDYVATARRLIGAPYLWGGRTSLGLDCSALVQL